MKAICKICNKEFTHWRYDRTPRFCSWDCRIKSKDKIIKCPECGIEFRVSQGKNRKFCSQTCSNRYNRKPDPTKKSIFICKWCGKEFEEWSYRHPTICSNQCRSEYGAIQPKPSTRRPDNFVKRICMECGKEFTIHKCQLERNKNQGAYCSVDCRGAAKSRSMIGDGNPNYEGGTLDFSAYGPNWGRIKRKIIRRDHGTCRVCGITGIKMDVHHIRKLRYFDSYEEANQSNNLMTVCRKCHRKLDRKNKVTPHLGLLRQLASFSVGEIKGS